MGDFKGPREPKPAAVQRPKPERPGGELHQPNLGPTMFSVAGRAEL